MTRAAEPFERVPRRIFDALRTGELSTTSFAVLVFLIGSVDRRTGVAVYTLRALADALQWERSLDWLWKQLRDLRSAGWIEFESKAGQRKPYVIRLRRAAVLDDATSDRPPTHLRPTSDSRPPFDSEVDLRVVTSPNGPESASEAESTSDSTSDSRAGARRRDVDEEKDPP